MFDSDYLKRDAYFMRVAAVNKEREGSFFTTRSPRKDVARVSVGQGSIIKHMLYHD